MQLPLQTFSTLVSNAAAAVQGAASQLLDLSAGSVLRAVLEANASVALWLQWLILQVLRTTRAATSQAGDLDSWMADFSFTRFGAVAAHGSLTFGRFAAVAPALVPVGVSARTADGTQTFTVVADTANPAFSPAQNGFTLAAGVASVAVAATAATPGSGGNVQPGAVTLIGSAVPGIDTVTNATAFQGGIDAEADTAFRSRFPTYLAGLARATELAVRAAIQSVQQGLLFNIVENQMPDGSSRMGFFTVTVDDGTGYPPSSLLASVTSAIEAVRPIGSQFAVQAPTVLTIDISLAVTSGFGVPHATTAANVVAVLTGFVNSFALGAPLTWSRIVQVAYSADANVINVTDLLLNGGTSDVLPSASTVLKAGAIVAN
ncbi:MAG TPA: baseplate J/gp47 family protein [Acetobacteraceae bacterium]|jgi:uncharacterized phage protein gp47/JayE|nr:baseplate J/gp47 family protein [Acetobacteraceae bacterium]